MKKLGFILSFTVLVLMMALFIAHPSRSSAAFNANNLIDDSVFANSGAMNASQIDSLLNSYPGSCISSNNGFITPDPQGWSDSSSSFVFGGNVSAGKAIYDAAQNYHLNPQVILATLQKEQSLVTGGAGCHQNTPDPASATPMTNQCGSGTRNCTLACQYAGGCVNIAMGYGCPSYCDSKYEGFSKQIIWAAWVLRFAQERSQGIFGYAGQDPGDENIPYTGPTTQGCKQLVAGGSPVCSDGKYTLADSSTVTITNGATASLYRYTPFQSGNQNFDTIFTNWFGAPYANANDYSFVTSSATALHYNPGQTGSVTIVLQNTGYNTWYSDHNLPAGKNSTRLATIGYQNSPFINPDVSSLYTQNQVLMTPDTVAPGENATFTFNVSAPYRVMSWQHRLVPIVNGVFLKDVGINAVLYSDTPAWNPTSSTVDTQNLLPNQQSHAHFEVQNNSASTWYSDDNLPAGKQPTRLATVGYQDTPFADTSDPNWLGTHNQIKLNEASVAPGQTATFDAWFIAPVRSSTTNNSFHFILIVGGVFTQDKGLVFNFSTPAANLTFTGMSATNPPANMSTGQTAAVTFTAKNTGNVVWQDELYNGGAHSLRLIMTHPLYRTSAFYNSSDSNWLSVGQVKMPTGTVWPGQTVTFSWTWKAPAQTGTYHDQFQLAIGGLFYPDYGSTFNTTVQ